MLFIAILFISLFSIIYIFYNFSNKNFLNITNFKPKSNKFLLYLNILFLVRFYDFNDEYFIYHMNHFSSGMVAEKKNLFEKLDKNQIPYLTNEEFLDLALKLSKNPNYLKTDEFWGLHNEVLN